MKSKNIYYTGRYKSYYIKFDTVNKKAYHMSYIPSGERWGDWEEEFNIEWYDGKGNEYTQIYNHVTKFLKLKRISENKLFLELL